MISENKGSRAYVDLRQTSNGGIKSQAYTLRGFMICGRTRRKTCGKIVNAYFSLETLKERGHLRDQDVDE
jgi:hypothetical protein